MVSTLPSCDVGNPATHDSIVAGHYAAQMGGHGGTYDGSYAVRGGEKASLSVGVPLFKPAAVSPVGTAARRHPCRILKAFEFTMDFLTIMGWMKLRRLRRCSRRSVGVRSPTDICPAFGP